MDDKQSISEAFKVFVTETPEHQKSWMEMVQK